MGKYLEYLGYVVRHKWFVLVECWKLGIVWQGIIHDLSKLRYSELVPYANFFYQKKRRDTTGYYKPTDTGDESFDFAWLLHQKRNKHHWQWWGLPEDEGGLKVLPMPLKYCLEMVADWCGASKAQGHGGYGGSNGVLVWYHKHKHKMSLHPDTRAWVEEFLVKKAVE